MNVQGIKNNNRGNAARNRNPNVCDQCRGSKQKCPEDRDATGRCQRCAGKNIDCTMKGAGSGEDGLKFQNETFESMQVTTSDPASSPKKNKSRKVGAHPSTADETMKSPPLNEQAPETTSSPNSSDDAETTLNEDLPMILKRMHDGSSVEYFTLSSGDTILEVKKVTIDGRDYLFANDYACTTKPTVKLKLGLSCAALDDFISSNPADKVGDLTAESREKMHALIIGAVPYKDDGCATDIVANMHTDV